MIQWYAAKGTHISLKDTHRIRVKEWRKAFQTNGNKKNNEIHTYIKHVKLKTVKKYRVSHYIMKKKLTHPEDITIVSVYASSIRIT